MVRRFVTLDGEITGEVDWDLNPTHRCFWCSDHLIFTQAEPCYESFDGTHDFVTICNKETTA